MTANLPVPIEFQLPEGWRPVSRREATASGVVFLALHPQPDAGYTANIAVDGGYRPDSAPLTKIADESVHRLREVDSTLVVSSRREVGSPTAPGLTQKLAFAAAIDDRLRELMQTQVYLSLNDINDPRERMVLRLVLTATATQHDAVLGDFQEFVRTVRPDTQTASP
ncbi:hypothetical protein DQ392_01980 [Streptomyces reniochalinae]|uniref:DUF1795 domain-containing protein n=1 Tax=Streptomyces reniochalinae TaxID=2250578 RepID=A0A367F635_9ACTN|nr:hypothetical protein DQ392_01980 [Streptomyces reniochalinae]